MTVEKKVVKIEGFVEKIEDVEEIKTNIDSAFKQQKQIRKLIYLFVLVLFLIVLVYIFS